MHYILAVLGLFLFAAPVWAAGPGNTDLAWTDTSTNEEGFQIERMTGKCTDTPTFAKIGEVAKNVNTYKDATTAVGYRYCFRVRAFNYKVISDPESAQFSGYSNTAGIEFPLAPPTAAPSGLTAQ